MLSGRTGIIPSRLGVSASVVAPAPIVDRRVGGLSDEARRRRGSVSGAASTSESGGYTGWQARTGRPTVELSHAQPEVQTRRG